jgi:hypothetical protein
VDEDSLAARYAELEDWTDGQMGYDETAGLKQLYRRKPVTPFAVLERAYAAPAAPVGGATRGR